MAGDGGVDGDVEGLAAVRALDGGKFLHEPSVERGGESANAGRGGLTAWPGTGRAKLRNSRLRWLQTMSVGEIGYFEIRPGGLVFL